MIEKALRDRHTKRRREKELDGELETLETHLEAVSKSQPLAQHFPKNVSSKVCAVAQVLS